MISPLTEGKTLGSMSNRIHCDEVNERPDVPKPAGPINNKVVNKTTTIKALEHAIARLNQLPHRYADTDFKLLELALKEQYALNSNRMT